MSLPIPPPGGGGPPEKWLKENSFPVGRVPVPRRLLEGNIALLGGAGSGKTTLLKAILAWLLMYKPDYMRIRNGLSYDPKNELASVLLSLAIGVRVINGNPLHRHNGAVWDMAKDIDDPLIAFEAADRLIPEKNDSSNKFYRDVPVLSSGSAFLDFDRRRPGEWTPRQAHLVLSNTDDLRLLFLTSEDPYVRSMETLLDPNQGSTYANIKSSILTSLHPLWIYAILFETCPPDRRYSIRDLVRSNDTFLCLGSDPRYASVLDRLVALQLIVYSSELLTQSDSRAREHLFVVDELARLLASDERVVEMVLELSEWGRSKGVRNCLGLQSTIQLERHGKDLAELVLGLCRNKIILRLSDNVAAEAGSRNLGRVRGYEWLNNISQSINPSQYGPVLTTSHGVSENFYDRAAVEPDIIAQLPVASYDRIAFYSVVPGVGPGKWLGSVDRRWIEAYVPDRDPRILPYDECRKDLRGLRLPPLSDTERRWLGLFQP